jgi:hypothetical protein
MSLEYYDVFAAFLLCLLGSWIDVAKISKDDILTPTKVYLLAYYWSATSFSGAGFGDITAQDTTHMILAICINIHGVLFFGYNYLSDFELTHRNIEVHDPASLINVF